MFFNDNDILFFKLIEGKELIGQIESDTIDYIKIKGAVHIIQTILSTPQGNVPQKAFLKASEEDNFEDDLFVKKDKIVFVKRILPASNVYKFYMQTTTGLSIPDTSIKAKSNIISFKPKGTKWLE